MKKLNLELVEIIKKGKSKGISNFIVTRKIFNSS